MAKNILSEVKGQRKKWEKIYTTHITDKELISGIHKEFFKIEKKIKTENSMEKRAKIWTANSEIHTSINMFVYLKCKVIKRWKIWEKS